MANPPTAPKHLLLSTKPAAIRIAEFRNDKSGNYAFSSFDKVKFLNDLLDRVVIDPSKNIGQDSSRFVRAGSSPLYYIDPTKRRFCQFCHQFVSVR